MTEPTALDEFAGGYINEDWRHSYGNEQATLQAFIDDNPGFVEALADEIQSVLDSSMTDREVEAYLDDRGAAYVAVNDFASYREWLADVEGRLRAALKDSGS